MKASSVIWFACAVIACNAAVGADAKARSSGERKRSNLVSELLKVAIPSKTVQSFAFTRASAGWIFISATTQGIGPIKKGTVAFAIDKAPPNAAAIVRAADGSECAESMRYVTQGEHQIRLECEGGIGVTSLVVKAIPELIHCGLGFDPAIKSYGRYDMDFLKKDILPNVTTLIVPHNINLSQSVIDDWHRQGKRFVGEVGLNGQGKTGDDDFKFYAGFFDRAPFLDGLIINEFGMNRASKRSSPQRQSRAAARHRPYEEAFKKMRADSRYKDKTLIAYFGGSGNVVNYDDTGTTFCRTLINCQYPIALERYIFERSSEKLSKDALQAFVDGVADWAAKEPGVKPQMIIAFGLFSMPPGGINKLPNVDYHVWMDQQMNVVANNPVMVDMGGLEWWTTSLTDEETVRFVGKLYRHYAIEGKTEMLTRDPLFLRHLQNADFKKGTEGWTLQPAAEGTISAKTFPRYGRIEGRYMGLGRPPDPEHIGDTFLWMKRSQKGPNTFSQTIKDLQPGRLYSMKLFTCDYNDLAHPKAKTKDQANKFIGQVALEGVELDTKRSFMEMYSTTPEPKIPIWITYHWNVFRATGTKAKLIVSDWQGKEPSGPFGQEQTFNFVELEPYHE